MLPVEQCKSDLLRLISDNQVLVVCGETGSGKSTQIPQYLLESGLVSSNAKLAITQPRRLAACALATRVSEERNCVVGSEVGYSVRFADRTSPQTALKFVTDGTLLREMLNDPLLNEYGAVMLDETHERTISTDVILGLLKSTLLPKRPEFKVIVSSATLDQDKLAKYFDPPAAVYSVPGRLYPVSVLYSTAEVNKSGLCGACVSTIYDIHKSNEDGDILVFLPGQDEIQQVERELQNVSSQLGTELAELTVVPLFASMPDEQQQRVFQPSAARKVVLATNIAETSLTIDGIKFVIDSGLVKQQNHGQSGIASLQTVWCSQASAKQRAGRAGRIAPGKCFRLYSKHQFSSFAKQTEPELLRSNLSSTNLLLLSMGVPNLLNFPWMDRPNVDTAVRAMQTLYALGAVDKNYSLTKLGRLLVEFPLDPQLAKTVLVGRNFASDVCVISAMLGELGTVFQKLPDTKQDLRKQFTNLCGDHLTLLNVYRAAEAHKFSKSWCKRFSIQYRSINRARSVADQLNKLLTKVLKATNYLPEASSSIVEAFHTGYTMHAARASNNRQNYVDLHLECPVFVHPGSVLHGEPLAELIIYHELVATTKEYMRGCLKVK